jgi:hypothetical protein
MTWTGPNFKPPRGSGRLDRRARKAQDEAELRAAYEEVDRRDGGFCRVTGRYTQPGAVAAESRREHHHLKGRRVRPEWVTDPKRIITVSREVHEYLTGHLIEVEGDDATKPLFFHWNEKLMRGRVKPFRLQGKRTAVA